MSPAQHVHTLLGVPELWGRLEDAAGRGPASLVIPRFSAEHPSLLKVQLERGQISSTDPLTPPKPGEEGSFCPGGNPLVMPTSQRAQAHTCGQTELDVSPGTSSGTHTMGSCGIWVRQVRGAY